MILPVVLIALLLCTGTEAASKSISECRDWACFTPKTCKGKITTGLETVLFDDPLTDNCATILMIRPYSKTKWLVVIESWDSSVADVKVMQDTTELFSCKKEGSTSEASSSLLELEKQEIQLLLKNSAEKLSCQFLVSAVAGSVEVMTVKEKNIKLITKASAEVENTMIDRDFLSAVTAKVTCDMDYVKFEPAESSEELAEQAQVSLDAVSCANYKLQYKSGEAYQDATSIACVKEGANYLYKITTDAGETPMDSAFYARCATKVCTLCTSQPTTPSGATAPTLGDVDGCKTLTCPAFFKIGEADPTTEKAVCAKSDSGEEYQWKIGNKTVEPTTEVACVDKMPCKKIASGCDSPCTLDEATGMPSCADKTHTLSITIDSKPVALASVQCDGSRGKLTYTADKNATDLPDGATFTCTAPVVEQQVSSAGMPTAMQACLAIATVLCLAIIGGSVALFIWKKRKNKAKASKDDDNKSKTGEK